MRKFEDEGLWLVRARLLQHVLKIRLEGHLLPEQTLDLPLTQQLTALQDMKHFASSIEQNTHAGYSMSIANIVIVSPNGDNACAGYLT